MWMIPNQSQLQQALQAPFAQEATNDPACPQAAESKGSLSQWYPWYQPTVAMAQTTNHTTSHRRHTLSLMWLLMIPLDEMFLSRFWKQLVHEVMYTETFTAYAYIYIYMYIYIYYDSELLLCNASIHIYTEYHCIIIFYHLVSSGLRLPSRTCRRITDPSPRRARSSFQERPGNTGHVAGHDTRIAPPQGRTSSRPLLASAPFIWSSDRNKNDSQRIQFQRPLQLQSNQKDPLWREKWSAASSQRAGPRCGWEKTPGQIHANARMTIPARPPLSYGPMGPASECSVIVAARNCVPSGSGSFDEGEDLQAQRPAWKLLN